MLKSNSCDTNQVMFLGERLGQPGEKRNLFLCTKVFSAPRTELPSGDIFFLVGPPRGPFKSHKCAISTSKSPEGRRGKKGAYHLDL